MNKLTKNLFKTLFCLMAVVWLTATFAAAAPSAQAETKYKTIKLAQEPDDNETDEPNDSGCDTDSCEGTGSSASTEPAQIKPTLSIDIPTIKFSDIATDESYIHVPWLAEYFSGVYKYAVGIGALLAAVMMIIGGFIYLTAGDSGRIAKGKTLITDALLGLAILLASYIILNTVNPDLIALDALKIQVVSEELFIIEEPGGMEEGTEPEAGVDYAKLGRPAPTKGSPSPGGDHFDPVFKKYAGCANVDYRVLKAVAKKESAFKTDLINRFGFIGLFQTKPKFCSLKRYGRKEDCTYERLADPDINTASAAGGQLKAASRSIRSICPSIKDTDRFVMLLYYGHNSGNGALRWVLKNVGCNGTKQDYYKGGGDFWLQQAKKKGKPLIHNYNKRMQYASKVADAAKNYGVTQPVVSGPCPI